MNGGGLATFTEGKKWTSAEHLLEQAKRDGERLPILFAPAEDTRSLLAWGVLDEIEAGETTIYSCSGLQFFNPRPKKTTLRLHSNNKPLAVGFIRPYAICITPHKLLQQLVPNTDCSTYLLTWNPELWNGELASNKSVEWSCGNSKRIRTGDRLFLMRQGSEPRGICASGVAMSDVISDQDGRSVEMHIEAFRNPETESILGRTALDELNRNTDHPMNWSIQISGTQIPPEVAQRLEIAWAKLCSDGPTPQPRIRFIDPELLRKIEEAAVSLVTSDLKGWSIRTREHEANLGFDLECSRGSEVMHLEVKGTTDSYPCFNLQASQYKAASNDKHWRIAVVTNALHPEIAKVTYFDGDTFLRSFAIDPTQYRARLKDDANT